jgi:hypothetical protein
VRKNEGKPRLHKAMFMPKAIEAMVDVIEFGESKYTPARERSWMNYKVDETMDSLLRHVTAVINGETDDPESGLPHLSHALFNASVLVELVSSCPSEDSPSSTGPEGS